MGYFNSQISTYLGDKNHLCANERGQLLEQFMCTRHLVSINSQSWSCGPSYTYRSGDGLTSSMIDHILIENSKCDLVISCTICDDNYLNVSDHLPVQCILNISGKKRSIGSSNCAVNWKKVTTQDIEKYKHVLSKLIEGGNFDVKALAVVDAYVLEIVSILQLAAEITLPFKKYKSYLKPYWNHGDVMSLHKSMRQLRSVWIAQGRPRGPMFTCYRNYKEAKKRFRKELDYVREDYEKKQFEQLESLAEIDVGTFYKAVRAKRNYSVPSSEIRVDGQIIRDPDVIRQAWRTHYSALATPTIQPHFDNNFERHITNCVNNMYTSSFANQDGVCEDKVTLKELKHALSNMNNGKAGGHDGIVVEHLKFAGDSLLGIIADLYNLILERETYPKHFKYGIVISLFKGGKKDKLNMDNYRDITLTPVLQKLLEKILYTRISYMCDNIKFPHPLQQGFRKYCGSVTAAFVVKESIAHYIERDSRVFAAFLDNRKAFNSVWIDGFLYKLYMLGFNGKFWRLLQNSFHEVYASVLFDGKRSEKYPVLQGVGQGRVLSAWCFLVMIDGLAVELDNQKLGLKIGDTHIPCVILADDTMALASSVRFLQCQIDIIYKYSCLWRLNYNPTKSSIMMFTMRHGKLRQPPLYECTLGSVCIPWTSIKTYAGISFTPNLQSNKGIIDSCEKGRKTLNSLIGVGIHPQGLNPITSSGLVKKVVLPSMTYGCELWNTYSLQSVEELKRTQRYSCRRCIGLPKTSPSSVTIQSVGLLDIWGEVENKKLMFWNKLCNGSMHYLWKVLFVTRLCDFIYGSVKNPCGFIPDILKVMRKFNMESFFFEFILSSTAPEKLAWSKFIRVAITDWYHQKWRTDLASKNELSRYAAIHTSSSPHPLLTLGLHNSRCTWELVNLMKLSITFVKEEVTCKLCKKQCKDIVMHFLIQCPVLYQSRDKLMDDVVNAINVKSYVNFSHLSEEHQCNFLLGDKQQVTLSESEWDQLMLNVSKHIKSMLYAINFYLI